MYQHGNDSLIYIDVIHPVNVSLLSAGLLLSPRCHLSAFQMMALNQFLLLEPTLSLKSREGPPTPMSRQNKGNCSLVSRDRFLQILQHLFFK